MAVRNRLLIVSAAAILGLLVFAVTRLEYVPGITLDNKFMIGSFTKDTYATDQYTRIRYSKPRAKIQDSTLILSAIDGDNSYGKGRDINSYLKTLLLLHKSGPFSLGFIVRSEPEFQKIVETIDNMIQELPFVQATLVYAPFLDDSLQIDSETRHDPQIQGDRRSKIARIRNFLLSQALDLEKYTLFVDSDIKKFRNSRELLKTFIESEYDIVVPRIIKGEDLDYDKNSWSGERTKPSVEQLELLDAKKPANYVPKDKSNMFHFSTYLDSDLYNIQGKNKTYSVELDSVGGAVLFAKSVIYQQGIIFPTSYIVGTTWDRIEGYDGVETEGLCYLAKRSGYSCWGMPNQVAFHLDR